LSGARLLDYIKEKEADELKKRKELQEENITETTEDSKDASKSHAKKLNDKSKSITEEEDLENA
jgi:hypothetical protein